MYQKKPSEILAIDDEYTAFCFDEVAFYLYCEATDKEGRVRWNRIRWESTEKGTNRELMEFIEKHHHTRLNKGR